MPWKVLTWILFGLAAPISDTVYGDAIFTDEKVYSVLNRNDAGVFYTWSPHMPLSVDGLAEIYAAGKKLNLVIVPVLSPHANLEYARDRLADRGYSDSVLRQGNSALLNDRDLFVHAPAILIFKDGEFVSPVLPGFRLAADYEQLIARFLQGDE